MSDEKVIPMPAPEAVAVVAEEPVNNDKPTILINKRLGEGENSILIFADLEYVLADIGDYDAKLREARRIPQDDAHISPDDPILPIVEQLDEVKKMPTTTRAEQEARNREVGRIVHAYYAQLAAEVQSSAIMLALTVEGNGNLPEPTPYEEPKIRQRPGLITLPQPKRDLRIPVEARLKSIMDRVMKIPGALKELNEAIDLMAVDVRGRLQPRDKDGFRSE